MNALALRAEMLGGTGCSQSVRQTSGTRKLEAKLRRVGDASRQPRRRIAGHRDQRQGLHLFGNGRAGCVADRMA